MNPNLAIAVMVSILGILFASTPTVAQTVDDRSPAGWFEVASTHLPDDVVIVGSAMTTAGPGFELHESLLPGTLDGDEAAASTDELRRLFGHRFAEQLGFDHRTIDAVVYGVGPASATIVVFGPTSLQTDARESRPMGDYTAYRLKGMAKGEPDVWAVPVEDSEALVLLPDHPPVVDAWPAAPRLAGSERLAKLKARFDDAPAGSDYVAITAIVPESPLGKALSAQQRPKALSSLIAVDSSGTVLTKGDGGAAWVDPSELVGSPIKSFVRDAYRARENETGWPLMAVVGSVAYHIFVPPEPSEAREAGTTSTVEFDTGLPIAMIALFSAAGSMSLQQELARVRDAGTQRSAPDD